LGRGAGGAWGGEALGGGRAWTDRGWWVLRGLAGVRGDHRTMTSREFSDRVRRRAARAGVQVPAALLGQLEAYFRLLEAWNAKMNLTALDLVRDGDKAVDRLLIEPLVAAKHVGERAKRAIDIGSGGGSPAIPMQLARPDIRFTLVEAKTRKCAFLREAGRQLGLGFDVETARYEVLLSRPGLHEAFDVCTMRAVRVESKVLTVLQAFLKSGGEFLLFRGPGGGDVQSTMTPLLTMKGVYPLVESLQSRLLILEKRPLGVAAGLLPLA
jgi:16S rRNA (guanine527-N7)-methyltransferase